MRRGTVTTLLLPRGHSYEGDKNVLYIIGLTLASTQADSQNEYVLLPRPSLMYILEYSRIYKVGDPTGPYACMEWLGIQIPQALLTLLDDTPLLCPFSQEEGYT